MVPTVSLYFSSSESTTIAASASRTRSLSASAETTKSLTPPPTPTPTWIATPSLTLSLVSHNITASPTITLSPTTTAIPTLSTTPTSSESTPSSTESFLTHTASTTFSVSSTNLSTVSSSRTYPNCSVPLAVLFTDGAANLDDTITSITQNSTTSTITNEPINCFLVQNVSQLQCTAGCAIHDAVAILDDTITSITQNSTTSTITIDDLCGVLWPSSDSPSMQLLHCVYPAVVASGRDNLTWSVAVSSLPVTPVRMVFGFTLSPSWSMQPFNDTSTSNIDLSNVTMRVVQSAYQGTLGFVSTVVSVPPTYGSVLVVPLVARCATEHIKFSIIVLWPAAPAVTTATVVTTTLASTVGAALGGDVVSAASLVLLSMLSCNTLAPNPGVSGYVMSVFFDDGPVSMVTGNVGIGAFVSLCQFGLVSVVARLRSQSHDDVAATLRFPAVSIRATDFLLPGTMYSALTFWSTEIGAVATGVFGAMVVVVALVALEYFYAVLYVLPLCDYAKYNTSHYPTGHWLEARFLFPTWQWYPRGVRSRFWPMMGPYVPGKTWVRGVIMCLALLLALVAGMASSGVGCVSGAWTAGIIHIAVAVVLVALKPFRVPSDALLGPLGTTIIGMACCLKATGNDDAVAVSDDITTAMALLQVVRTLIGLWVQWREGQWISEERSLESQHDVEEGRDGSDKIAEWDDGEDVPMSLLQSNDDGTERWLVWPRTTTMIRTISVVQ
ncbi:transmembrane protein, putative [Bodo saltans]|uniref:Transmembrane protein, putative n=1 Tax=Bodo saltans TaxID=75058 RepID=A0A0S4J146_BODSA|nr:transmembrane protein, putative [Bodo saltans]|eukprot:CUG28029.1 transmembrane protein, putative [Bodo saltans]